MSDFGILFDMDGVIVDTLNYHIEAARIFAEKHGYDISADEIKNKYFGRRNQDWMPELLGGNLTSEQIQELIDEKELYFRELYEADLKPLDGLMDLLEELKNHNVPMVVASSAPGENVRFIVDKLNANHYFKALLDDSYVTKGKPEPDIYIKAAKAIGMPPDKCIVIEDSEAGILSGKRARSKVIGITTTHPREDLPETDLMIDSLKELNYEKLRKLIYP